MSLHPDVYTAITGYGRVEVEFPDDGGIVFSGPPEAVEHIKDVMSRAVSSLGVGLTEANIEPVDFVRHCQPEGGGVIIVEPFDDLIAHGSILDRPDPD